MFKDLLNKRKQEGFTIIEVMIVLAIAGLIMVVVLIAVPQLQRNQRNEARRAIMGRISTEVSNYAGNNNGRVPVDDPELISFQTRYLGCTAASGSGSSAVGRSCTVNIEDPSTGIPFEVQEDNSTLNVVPTPQAVGIASYNHSKACNGESLVDGTNRSYALYTQLEGGAIYCLDNL